MSYRLGMHVLVLFARVLIGDPMPALELATLDGGSLALPAAGQGHITVIDFFATWCGPCRESLPALERLRARFAEQGVVFVSISEDEPGSATRVARFAAAMKLGGPVLLDPQRSAFARMGARRLPTVYIVDAAGVVRRINNGYGSGFEHRMGRWLALLTAGPP
jgi:thiol-disulfide isomerase/thioredoxin